MLLRRMQKERSSDELRREVLELRKLADRLRDHAEQLATRSEELEKLVQRARSSETKSP
jgi:uncharacterized coiled-coil protein SlyX